MANQDLRAQLDENLDEAEWEWKPQCAHSRVYERLWRQPGGIQTNR
ncbi:MAG: hypothetical protein MJK14_23400 [Rivularia sp. ALOHA_DT_140]|nr:hypothetical protein [Rivularia sp. ALOHA_DT_140]